MHRPSRIATAALIALAATLGGCASSGAPGGPLTATEQWRAGLCEQVLGVSRMACIQQTAGRPGSPYDAAGRPVTMTAASGR